MRELVICVLICFTSFVSAQSEYNYLRDYYHYSNNLIGMIPGQKGQTVEVQTTVAKNGHTYSYLKSYDDFANLIKSEKTEKGKTTLLQSNTFNEEGAVLERKIYSKGKPWQVYQFKRDTANRVTSFKKIRKGKLKTYNVYSYNTPNKWCYLQSISYKKDGISIDKQWDYEYYDNACDKKKSVLKNGKGKVLKTWTYDCKEEGEVITKKKDVKQVCKWEETDGNFLKKVYQSFDEKGRTYTNVQLYRLVDTVIVSSIVTYEDSSRYEVIYNPDIKKVINSRSISRKGKVTHEYTYAYKDEKLLNSAYKRKGKEIWKREYTYDSNDLLVAFKYFGKEEKLTYSGTLAYK